MSQATDSRGNLYTYDSEWIGNLEREIEWRRYWHQQSLLEPLLPKNGTVLELGPGSGFTANYLRGRGHSVTTLDIDPDKNPDICVNIADYEFPGSYDVVTAFEVMEHVPFDVVCDVLPRIKRCCTHFVFSVPSNKRTVVDASLKLPKLQELSFGLGVSKRGKISRNHHWELGPQSIPKKRLSEALDNAGMEVIKMASFKHWNFFVIRCPQ